MTHIAYQMMNQTELARLLGIHRYTLRMWIDLEKIGPEPVNQIGKVMFYRVAEVRAWIDAGMPRRELWVAERKRQSRRARA